MSSLQDKLRRTLQRRAKKLDTAGQGLSDALRNYLPGTDDNEDSADAARVPVSIERRRKPRDPDGSTPKPFRFSDSADAEDNDTDVTRTEHYRRALLQALAKASRKKPVKPVKPVGVGQRVGVVDTSGTTLSGIVDDIDYINKKVRIRLDDNRLTDWLNTKQVFVQETDDIQDGTSEADTYPRHQANG